MKSLDGLKKLVNLRSLGLGLLPQLASLEAISEIATLEELRLEDCRHLTSLDSIGRLSNLRALTIDNCGDIESLAPLAQLTKIEVLSFIGNTRISDGDLSVLLRLPKLQAVFFGKCAGYSHTQEEIEAELLLR